jgi:hypothetical protein
MVTPDVVPKRFELDEEALSGRRRRYTRKRSSERTQVIGVTRATRREEEQSIVDEVAATLRRHQEGERTTPVATGRRRAARQSRLDGAHDWDFASFIAS